MIKVAQMQINGMTCAACAQASERAVKKLPVVEEAAVNFATEKLFIKFDDEKLGIDEIQAAVAKAGYEAVEIALVIPVIAAGHRFYSVGFKAIVHRSPNMDSLIAMGISAAILYSLFSVLNIANGNFRAVENLYFETAGVIITLILLGKSLEAVTKGRTSESIKKLMGLQSKTATIIRNGIEVEIPIDEVEVGDIIRVRPGEKIPVDGVIVTDRCSDVPQLGIGVDKFVAT